MNNELPNAERILLTKIIEASPGEDYESIEDEILKVTNDPAHRIVIEAMHEYARRVLDVAAVNARVKRERMINWDTKEKTTVSERFFSNGNEFYQIDLDSILRLKELLK